MMLNRLLSDLIGVMRNTDPRQLELKIGQIVNGTVLKLLAENEALVNIGGMTVHAKLEAPLQPGQRTLLQVQPESTADTIVLRPLQGSNTRIADTSLGELLAAFRVKDSESNRQLLQHMHAAGIPIDKNTFRQFRQIADARPAAIPEQQWLQAAIAADRKGLPMTREIVASLHRALFGGTLTAQLADLDEALARFISSGAGPRSEGQGGALETARQLQEAIRHVMQTAAQGARETAESQGNPARSAQSQAPVAPPQSGPDAAAGRALSGSGPGVRGSGAEGALAHEANARSGPSQPPAAGEHPARPAGDPAAGAARSAAAAESAPSPRPASPMTSAMQGEASREASQGRQAQQTDVAEPRPAPSEQPAGPRFVPVQSSAEARSPHWIHAFMKQIGLDHEHRIAELLLAPQREAAAADMAARPENVKALLMALLDSAELPQTLRDAAQNLLHHITGQQLMLGTERGMPFTTVTLFIPVPQQDGSETVAVHIQSRRKQEGGLDPENCRLLFDLRMERMGDTLIDVQVVDRIVSLQVFNDHAATGALLSATKPDLQAALAAIGYQCISVKHSPFPEPEGESAGAASAAKSAPVAALPDLYGAVPYKGVDIRV